MPRPVPPANKKRQRIAINYDADFGNNFLIRTDLLISEDGQYESPVTSHFFLRVQEGISFSAIPKRDFEPRRIENCFERENKESIRTIICPYSNAFDISTQYLEIKNDYPSRRLRILGEQQSELIERGLL